MKKINREDMLELTRRMTLKRNCFGRIAGAYFDDSGFLDGTFNTHFLKLSQREREEKLGIAKAIPFSETNVNLKAYGFLPEQEKSGSIWQLLMGLRECELKNDAMLEILYELIGEKCSIGMDFAVYIFYGGYDIPRKGKDGESQWESEEVYRFLIGALCPVSGDYEPGPPECGFLFPAFSERSEDIHGIHIFQRNAEHPNREFCRLLTE